MFVKNFPVGFIRWRTTNVPVSMKNLIIGIEKGLIELKTDKSCCVFSFDDVIFFILSIILFIIVTLDLLIVSCSFHFFYGRFC